ncbi:MAG TPA: hypothetical protein VEI52_24490 [Terriglobales bacterium]|nr:hypothetical protein [Terriglobales bacterium]
MRPSVFFSAFEPLHETPEMCDVCHAKPPVLSYELDTYGTRGEAKEKKGFCCAHCTTILLRILERDESQRWAQEEAALKADDSDVSDFRRHRLAAFKDNKNCRV